MNKKEILKFYIVNEEYIEYLRQFDSHVSWNKEQKNRWVIKILTTKNRNKDRKKKIRIIIWKAKQ